MPTVQNGSSRVGCGPHSSSSAEGFSWPGPAPLLLLLLLLLVAACEGNGEAGSTIDDLPLLTLHEELRIGSTHDPDVGFSNLQSVAVDAEGRVYPFEIQDRQFRVYDPEGRELRRFGGAGSGPGEFEMPLQPRFGIVGDTLWAIEQFARRITLFSLEGHVITTGRFTGVPVGTPATSVAMTMPNLMTPEGYLLGHISFWAGASSSPSEPDPVYLDEEEGVRAPRIRFAPTGEVVDTIGWYAHRPSPSVEPPELSIGGTAHRLPSPPSSDPLEVFLADGVIVVERPVATSPDGDTLRVIRLGLDGDTVFRRDLAYRPVAYGSERLDDIAWRAVRIPTGAVALVGGQPQLPDMPVDSLDRFRRIRAALDYPPFQPPVSDHHLGSDESLWLRREDDGVDAFRWVVLDPQGEPRGRLELPREHRIAWSGGDTAWVIEPDEYDVPWLVRYRIEEAE